MRSMGRQELRDHITDAMHSREQYEVPKIETPALCQHCGRPIDPDDKATSDYVIHKVQSHGEDGMNSVYYCSPSCFTEAMEELFSP